MDFLYSKLKVKNYLNKILKKYEIDNDLIVSDEITGENYNIVDLIINNNERIKELEEKYKCALVDIKRLEEENIGLTNELYEIENRLQSQIDKIHPVVYNFHESKNLKDFTLGD